MFLWIGVVEVLLLVDVVVVVLADATLIVVAEKDLQALTLIGFYP